MWIKIKLTRLDLKKNRTLNTRLKCIIIIIFEKKIFCLFRNLQNQSSGSDWWFSDKWYAHPSCACCRLYSPIITENYNIFDIYLYFKQQTAWQGMKLQLIKHNHLLTIQQVRPNKFTFPKDVLKVYSMIDNSLTFCWQTTNYS